MAVVFFADISQILTSIHGEDVPFWLGMPLNGGFHHLSSKYTRQEKVLSEIMMNYLLNFVKYG